MAEESRRDVSEDPLGCLVNDDSVSLTMAERRAAGQAEGLAGVYDRLACEYASRYCDELDHKPFDRALLRRFAHTAPEGIVCDLGCGPGHVAAYLQSLRTPVMGIDLSPRMVTEARRRYPSLDVRVGDMLNLEVETASLAGIVAFYSIIHLQRLALPHALRTMHRSLLSGGLLLLAFHKGCGELHVDDVWGSGSHFDCALFEPEEVVCALENAGFCVLETTVRRPYEIEYPTRRVYVLSSAQTG